MSKQVTGRTEGIFIKVKPQIKDQIKVKLTHGFNLTEWFEQTWYRENSDEHFLELEITRNELILSELQRKLDILRDKRVFESSLTLNEKDTKTLVLVIDKWPGNDRKQLEFFKGLTNTELNLPTFLAIRNRNYNPNNPYYSTEIKRRSVSK
jgi:hypothetical protein